MRRETIATLIVIGLLTLFPASLFGYQYVRTNEPGVHTITVKASAPDNGDWQPKNIEVRLGERVRLRIEATDVVHGLVIPELGIEIDEILPGHVAEVDFIAGKAGRFAFACTRWCSVDHWRMRGVIEVVDPAKASGAATSAAKPPLFQQLGIDIDAMHTAGKTPQRTPSYERGERLRLASPTVFGDIDRLRRLAPAEVFALLRADASYAALSDDDLWDLIAYVWLDTIGSDSLARGQKLYGRDCAACHGEQGRADGTAGINLRGLRKMHPEMKPGPADFSDAEAMLGASDALLQGKILRGGMGTGMPEWGSLYAERDMWDVIAYIRSFVFAWPAPGR